MSKPTMYTYTKAAFISTPKCFRIDLAKTIMTLIPAISPEASALSFAPVPPRTVAASAGITTTRTQDILALVKEAFNMRTTRNGDVLIDFILIDDSTTGPTVAATSAPAATLLITV